MGDLPQILVAGIPILVQNAGTKAWHVLGEDGQQFNLVPAGRQSFSLAEVEGLLAAERDRCAKVADRLATAAEGLALAKDASSTMTLRHAFRHGAAHDLAAAIRNLPPEPIGGE